ncbi:MAG: hypothetical protein ACE5KM_21195 [Planctomycetaceae bacterium]
MTAGNNKRKWTPTRILWCISPLVLLPLWMLTPEESAFKQTATWQRMASPGALSHAHVHLENNCAACHSPMKGVEAANCIVCHANDEAILQRQPTAFHANIGNCKVCHLEHRGRSHRPTDMNHELLAQIGLKQLDHGNADSESAAIGKQLRMWASHGNPPHARISVKEALLNCATCHSNDDRHFQLFGRNCAECHATDKWTIPEFRHPSPSSTNCAQCHQAPPSHYMKHFKMVSARVAGKPHARVDQCSHCHQTTSWNDILGAGWYKHH